MVRTEGIYWLGLVLTVYAAFTLSKRASRAYNAVWGTPQLPVRAQWRALVWIVVQLLLIVMVTELRTVVRSSGVVARAAHGGPDPGRCGSPPRSSPRPCSPAVTWPVARILLAAAFATVGRFGIVVWSALFLTPSIVRQAESYGPIGVVFALFTGLLVYWAVLLGATLLAAVITDPDVGAGPDSMVADIDVAQGEF